MRQICNADLESDQISIILSLIIFLFTIRIRCDWTFSTSKYKLADSYSFQTLLFQFWSKILLDFVNINQIKWLSNLFILKQFILSDKPWIVNSTFSFHDSDFYSKSSIHKLAGYYSLHLSKLAKRMQSRRHIFTFLVPNDANYGTNGWWERSTESFNVDCSTK